MAPDLDPGDDWPNHYRGYRLHTNPDGDIWWQVYQGTDRLFLQPEPESLVNSLLDVKRLGGRVRITEGNDVLARVEDGDDYEVIWVGECSLEGALVPADGSEYSIPIQPSNVDSGDLWPSVYDGARYSFSSGGDRVWWTNPKTHKRHPVRRSLPNEVVSELSRRKPQGGSFRVTPGNDVLTLVDKDRLPAAASEQFADLPRVVKNVIKLRKQRGVEKLPIYVGSVDTTPFEVDDPPSLTDPVSAEDVGIDEWASSLGSTSETDESEHRTTAQRNGEDDGWPEEDIDVPTDDPADW